MHPAVDFDLVLGGEVAFADGRPQIILDEPTDCSIRHLVVSAVPAHIQVEAQPEKLIEPDDSDRVLDVVLDGSVVVVVGNEHLVHRLKELLGHFAVPLHQIL